MRRNQDDLWFSGYDGGDPWSDQDSSQPKENKKEKKSERKRPAARRRAEKRSSREGGSTAPAAGNSPPPSGNPAPNFRGYVPRSDRELHRRRQSSILPFFIVALVVVTFLFFAVGSVYSQLSSIGRWSVVLPWRDGSDGDEDAADNWDVETNEESDDSYSIAPYEGDTSTLSITLVSKEGKTALDYEELYEQCLPYTASITVYAGSSAAYGSGVVLTQDGFILTCAHVIDDMESATVTVYDGNTYDALLVGSDAQTDLAILKIEAEDLVPAEFGDSSELQIGETVCAIGDSLGVQFQSTLSEGIVSGLNREVSSNGYSMVLLQTTAAVNSGNSGGPLLNEFGQVVGIVNMKMSSSSSSGPTVDNMGFAIPSATVKDIVEGLASNGSIDRAVLGISCYGIDATSSVMSGLPEGLWVTSIQSGSLCGEGGLLEGDIITAVNGEAVNSVADFQSVTYGYQPGDTVTLTIWRDEDLTARIAAADASFDSATEDESTSEYNFTLYGDIEVELVSSSDLGQ